MTYCTHRQRRYGQASLRITQPQEGALLVAGEGCAIAWQAGVACPQGVDVQRITIADGLTRWANQ